MLDQARLIRALIREDLSSFMEKAFQTLEPGTAFQPNWHLHHLTYMLSRVARGEIKRLIVNVPPRSGKSLLASVAFPMWMLGHDPTRRVICVSHTDSLARKFSIDRRTVALSSWYQSVFPAVRLSSKRPPERELRTDQLGSIFAAGTGGAVLGRGADLIIVDDPLKGTDGNSKAKRRAAAEFFDNTLSTRLNDKRTGAIVIVMQRLHEDDLVGHVIGKGEWTVASLPAIATEEGSFPLSDDPDHIWRRRVGDVLDPIREPREVLEAQRRIQGSLTFAAQYQQNPMPAEGNIVRREWLQRFDRPPEFDRVVVSWDTASTLGETSDWSVGTVWGACGLDYYLIDLVRGRFETPDLRREIMALSRKHNADATLIEDTELGRALEQDLRRSGELRALRIRPQFDKEARLLAQSARFEARQVHVPQEAPWLADYLHELMAFPNGRHDDQVDSTSQALHYLTSRSAAGGELKRRDVKRRTVTRKG